MVSAYGAMRCKTARVILETAGAICLSPMRRPRVSSVPCGVRFLSGSIAWLTCQLLRCGDQLIGE